MKYRLMLLLLANIFATYAMECENHNTYKGVPITPQSLVTLVPKMPTNLQEQVDKCVEQYRDFISSLVTTPHPLTHENRKQKTTDNFALIDQYEKENRVKNHSTFNYILQFSEYPEFSMPINRWGSRVAYWMHASSQGNVLDEKFDPNTADCSLFENLPSYQHCSRAAHYLRAAEIAEKKNFKVFRPTPTYLQHIPEKPEELSDENYIVVQEWINTFKELRQLPEEERITIKKNISFDTIKELYEATVYAALWDLANNLGIDGETNYLHFFDLEEPFNHKPQFFYFQGEEGKIKYVDDVMKSLERMAHFFLEEPEQFNAWKRLSEEDVNFNALCNQYDIYVNYDPEHLRTKYSV